MTKAQVIALIDQYITTNGNEEITGAQTNSVMKALANQDIPFSEIVSTPTTLSGYGITDAYTKGQSDSRYVDVTGDTMTGNLTVGSQLNIIGSASGISNTSFLRIFESNGTTRQALFGFSTAATGDLDIVNDIANARIRIQAAGASNQLRFIDSGGNWAVWHSGNSRGDAQNDSRYALQSTAINAGLGLTGGGNLTANRTLSVVFGTSAGTVLEGDWRPSWSQITGTNPSYTKGESDSRYVNVTGDTMTGQLSATDLRTTNQGDGADLITFATERPWVFKQTLTGAATALSLVEFNSAGSKNFTIGDLTTPDKVTINAGTGNVSTVGNITATAFYESSDIRLKKNIEPLNYGLKEIEKIDTHTWNWKKDGSEDMGLIAQELELIMPELVKTNEEGYKSVNYSKLVPVLINAIKELSNG